MKRLEKKGSWVRQTGARQLCRTHRGMAAVLDKQGQGGWVKHTGARRLGYTHRGKASVLDTQGL